VLAPNSSLLSYRVLSDHHAVLASPLSQMLSVSAQLTISGTGKQYFFTNGDVRANR